MATGQVNNPEAAEVASAATMRSPSNARRLVNRLLDKRNDRVNVSVQFDKRFRQLNAYLGIADQVTLALEQLNSQLFAQVLGIVQEKLSVALQEILDQPICLKAKADFKSGAAVVEFNIERDGHSEDILRGQGGSVANILSVGLRIFALSQLDESKHRRFLVLDEQDCWLRPDLVPQLVKIVAQAGRELGFQTLMISHHDVESFVQYADKVYEFAPGPDGVQVRERQTRPRYEDPS